MTVGPMTTVMLRKPTETESEGELTTSWQDIAEFKAMMTTLSGSETERYGKETVLKMVKFTFDYWAPGLENIAEVTEPNRLRVGTRDFDIVWVNNVANENVTFVVHAEERDKRIT